MNYQITTDTSDIKGEIYLIENTINGKKYVGQALTHRKNHSKYRPFGYQGRFKDHISEAICNTKKKQCRYLNNAIRSYGKDAFKVSLLHTCPKDEINEWEIYYIQGQNTLYPNGYNLTKGGKTIEREKGDDIEELTLNVPKKRGGCSGRNEDTRKLITEQLKKTCNTEEHKKAQMLINIQQHSQKKYDLFKNEKIDIDNLDRYMRIENHKNGPIIKVTINKKRTSFVGKHQTLEELKERALEFLATIATLSNCSGNP